MLRILITLAFAASLTAQARRVTLDPPAPTSLTPIEARLFVVCQEESHTVNRVGNVIKIHITPGPELCDPPIASLVPVSIGTLPVGQYRIEVMVGALDSIAASRTFVVRDGIQRDFTIHPFAATSQPFGLPLRLEAKNDAVAKIFVDGVEIDPRRIERSTRDGSYWFASPPHAPGLVDVQVQTVSGAMVTLPGALYFYDHAARIDTSVFERILFPVLFESAGAHGSQWVSEAAIANPAPWYIETWNDVVPFQCIDYPCGERLSPGIYTPFNGAGYPNGIALIAPRAEADNLSFSLRVRDTARQAEGYGTQVPVVREDEMFRNTDLTLLDLPVDPRYRTKLRMYAFDTGEHEAHVMIHRVRPSGTESESHFVPVRRNCTARCEESPWYAEFDLPAGAIDERVNVYVTIGGADTPAWAFASVTNNETQQVTIVTADGAGGRPCLGCEVTP